MSMPSHDMAGMENHGFLNRLKQDNPGRTIPVLLCINANQRMVAQLMGKMPEIIRQNKQDIEDYAARKAKQDKAAEPKPVT